MLQQTTVSAVIPHYERWIRQYPDVESVARAGEQKILKSWEGLGYYSRAKNIREAARRMVRDHGGRIPSRRDLLSNLPGFGPYTTGAVLSIAFDKREVIIDANIRRVVMRLLCLEGVSDSRVDPQIRAYLLKVMPARNLRTFNQALMELGALICRPRQPLCEKCPVRLYCEACSRERQDEIPVVKKQVIEKIQTVMAVIRKNDKYFIQRRSGKGLFTGLWEFPSTQVQVGEDAMEALRRGISQDLSVEIISARELMTCRQAYTRFQVRLHVWLSETQPAPSAGEDAVWVSLDDLEKYPMPSGMARIVKRLRKMT